jgi:hypothetical protein
MMRLLLLCLAVVWAQIALAGHGIEHACHEPDEACIECLALPGMQAVPVQVTEPPEPPVAVFQTVFAVPPAPTLARPRTFLSRAPPPLRS